MSRSSRSEASTGERPAKKMRSGHTSYLDQFRGPLGRSCPGQPPAERYGRAYNMPFSELSAIQVKAARDLFGTGTDASHWENIMPRRSQGYTNSHVLQFQAKTWSQLTKSEKTAAKVLHITEKIWNRSLTPFHDDWWTIPGVTLTASEFSPVLRTIQKMGRSSSLTKKQLASFLFGLERLLLPSQGAAIIQALKASPSWESLLESKQDDDTAQYNSKFHVHLVVACFLSHPARFVDFPHKEINAFWDDDSGGCVWGNASGRRRRRNKKKKKTYAKALREVLVRRLVDPVLTGAKSSSGNESSIPALPERVAAHILDDVLGMQTESIDPFQVSWLYGYGAPLTIFFRA